MPSPQPPPVGRSSAKWDEPHSLGAERGREKAPRIASLGAVDLSITAGAMTTRIADKPKPHASVGRAISLAIEGPKALHQRTLHAGLCANAGERPEAQGGESGVIGEKARWWLGYFDSDLGAPVVKRARVNDAKEREKWI